jgi:ELWxxDGT repeat protein
MARVGGILAGFAGLACAVAAAAAPTLIRDINPTPGMGSRPYRPVALGDRLYFFADDGEHGAELWVSDGTSGGTRLVRDLNPGSAWGAIREVVAVGDRVVFVGRDAAHPCALFRSDGTAAGTRLVHAFPGNCGLESPGPQPSELTVVGETLYFAFGAALWRSDGSAAGTRPVRAGGADEEFFPHDLIAHQGALFFLTAHPELGTRLWRSDGTDAGTLVLGDSVVAGATGDSLWPVGALTLFAGADLDHGIELWRSDGTEAGTQAVVDLVPGPDNGIGLETATGVGAADVAVAGDVLFFTSRTTVAGARHDLWTSDGSAAGTRRVASLPIAVINAPPNELTSSGGRVFFSAFTSPNGYDLWASDGTAGGTRRVADINDQPPPSRGFIRDAQRLADIDGVLVFMGDDGEHGIEPWCSDGTAGGTRRLGDIAPGAASSLDPSQSRFWRPGYEAFVAAGATLFFAADDGSSGLELWAMPLADLDPPPSRCAGDCDRGGSVTVDELVRGVGIALGSTPVDVCAPFDANGDGGVAIDELVGAVRAALDGCSG